MAKDNPRQHRIADFIQRELSQLVRNELKDPRISPMLTIASVEVSSDLSNAKIYYTTFDADDRKETQEALVKAAGFLRRKLAASMTTRSVPLLRFYYDDSAEQGAKLSALIDQAMSTNTTKSDTSEGSSAEGGTSDSGTPEGRTPEGRTPEGRTPNPDGEE